MSRGGRDCQELSEEVVIDVGNDGEISYVTEIAQFFTKPR